MLCSSKRAPGFGWMLEDFFFDLFRTRIPLPEIIGRLSLAVVFGAAIGIDREFRPKEAGLRTHILVALAAAMFTVIAFAVRSEDRRVGNDGFSTFRSRRSQNN